MAGVRGYQARILVDQWDFSGQSNGITVSSDVKALDYSVLQNAGQLRIPGLPTGMIEHNGYHSTPGAGQLEYELNARLGTSTDVVVAAVLGTSEPVPVAYVLPTSFNSQLKVKAPIAGLLEVSGAWPAKSSQMLRGVQVFTGTISATGAQGAGIDMGAAGSAGGKFFLFISAISGTATNATVKLQSDSDPGFGTAADEGTATFSAVGAQTVTLSGTINRYLRLNCGTKGGATSFAVVGIACVDGVTY